MIQQGGGSKGHSSVEDSVASLDLVKWFVLNKKTKPTIATVGASGSGSGSGGGGGRGNNNNRSVDIGDGAAQGLNA
jgi:RNA exonuclease 1